MRSLSFLAVLCLSACVFRGDGVRNAITSDVLELSDAEDQLWADMLALAEHGKQLVPLLFGQGPGSMNELRSRQESIEPACNKEDNKAVSTAFSTWKRRFVHLRGGIEKEGMPLPFVANVTFGSLGQLNFGEVWKVLMTLKEMRRDAPASCQRIGNYATLHTCMLEATNVSRTCIQCIPKYFTQTSSCAPTCRDGVRSMYSTVQEAASVMRGTDGHAPPGGLGERGSPSDGDQSNADATAALEERQGKLTKTADALMDSLRKLVPCLECANTHSDLLMDCFNFPDAWKKSWHAVFPRLTSALMAGKISISDAGEMRPLQQQQSLETLETPASG